MIKIIDGDLLTSGADVICHQVNCQGKMRSGIAKQIREKYPEVFIRYSGLTNIPDVSKFKREELLGFCQFVPVENKQYIVNLFGQYGYGYDNKQYTDMDALKKSLLVLKDNLISIALEFDKKPSELRIAMPYKIGCVRGGADWNEVYSMIDEIFEYYNVELWKLDKG